MKYLRTASTSRLLATIAGLVIAVAAGTAIAVAATGSGPVPKAKPLADAIHGALTGPPVTGVTADINFTNNLISNANVSGVHGDPILTGATGRLWMGDHKLRLELQSSNGDAQLLVDHTNNTFWVSDPLSNTVYQGTLPADTSSSTGTQGSAGQGVPTIAQIQSDLNGLLKDANVAGLGTANPTDVGGQPAYSASISPKHSGGQLGSVELAWDAIRGVPLKVAVYARNNSTPVLELTASNISYGPVAASNFAVPMPAGYKVVKVSTATQASAATKGLKRGKAAHADISGVAAVAKQVPFTLVAPSSLVGLPRHGTSLLDWAGKPAALVTYGQGLGGIAVIEQTASGQSASSSSSSQGSTLSLPTVSINGATGQELDTALGTVLRFSKGGVGYTVIGSVSPFAAEKAARALAP